MTVTIMTEAIMPDIDRYGDGKQQEGLSRVDNEIGADVYWQSINPAGRSRRPMLPADAAVPCRIAARCR